jgi:hypothetical protein
VTGERGQATVELVAAAGVLAAVAVGLHSLFVLWAAQGRAQQLADQAAVVVAEGRPVPALLRREAEVRVDGRRLEVRLHVTLAGGLGETDAVARATLP